MWLFWYPRKYQLIGWYFWYKPTVRRENNCIGTVLTNLRKNFISRLGSLIKRSRDHMSYLSRWLGCNGFSSNRWVCVDNFDFSTSVFCIPNSVLVMYRDGLYSWAIFYLSTQCISTQYICFKNSFQLLSGEKPAPPARITPRYVKNNSMMRSKSSVVLNQHSDSDNDPKQKKMSRLMRPTISSHNKISQKPLQARKKQSYSTSKSGVSSLVILNVNRFFLKVIWIKSAWTTCPPRTRMTRPRSLRYRQEWAGKPATLIRVKVWSGILTIRIPKKVSRFKFMVYWHKLRLK